MNEEEAITYFHQILEKRGIKIDYSNWRNWLVDEEKEEYAILEYSIKLKEKK